MSWRYRGNNSKKKNNKPFQQKFVPSEEMKKQAEALEVKFGFERINEGSDRLGWLMNMQPSDMVQPDNGVTVSAVDYYFIQQDGCTFKVTLANHPYFYIYVSPAYLTEVESHLKIKFQKHIFQTDIVWKEDLELRNHLSGLKKQYLCVRFHTINDLLHVRSQIIPIIRKNENERTLNQTYSFWEENISSTNDDSINSDLFQDTSDAFSNPLYHIEDIREADVPFYIRTSIDYNIRVGYWYNVSFKAGNATLNHRYVIK